MGSWGPQGGVATQGPRPWLEGCRAGRLQGSGVRPCPLPVLRRGRGAAPVPINPFTMLLGQGALLGQGMMSASSAAVLSWVLGYGHSRAHAALMQAPCHGGAGSRDPSPPSLCPLFCGVAGGWDGASLG